MLVIRRRSSGLAHSFWFCAASRLVLRHLVIADCSDSVFEVWIFQSNVLGRKCDWLSFRGFRVPIVFRYQDYFTAVLVFWICRFGAVLGWRFGGPFLMILWFLRSGAFVIVVVSGRALGCRRWTVARSFWILDRRSRAFVRIYGRFSICVIIFSVNIPSLCITPEEWPEWHVLFVIKLCD